MTVPFQPMVPSKSTSMRMISGGLGGGELALGVAQLEHGAFEGFAEFRSWVLLGGVGRGGG